MVFEDNHLLIVHKPSSICTHGDGTDRPSLHKLAKEYLVGKYDKPGNVYLGVVNRLDREASGLVVFAKTSKAASRLSRSFRDRDPSLKKQYVCIVEGHTDDSGECRNVLNTATVTGLLSSTSGCQERNEKIEEAVLWYRTLLKRMNKNSALCQSLLYVDLLTGRKHQIRAQLAHLGHPIVNDMKYGAACSTKWDRNTIALHAWSLTIRHPILKPGELVGRSLRFTAPLPHMWKALFGPQVLEQLIKDMDDREAKEMDRYQGHGC